MLLGDADVEAAVREGLGERGEPRRAEHRRGDRDDVAARVPERHHLLGEHRRPAHRRGPRGATRLGVERRRAVHLLGDVVLRGRVAAALPGDGVHDHRTAEVPGPAQRRLHGRHVVPVDRPEVLEPEVGEQLLRAQRVLHPGLERVQPGVDRPADDRGPPQRVLAGLQHPLVPRLQPQRREPVRQAADRRGVGAPVVVDDDDHVAVPARRDVVERLPRHAAGQRAVADHRDDVALLPGERVRPRQPVRPRQRRGRVAVLDVVVLALGAARIAREPAGLLQPLPAVDPAGEQLVHVGLVAGVPDQRVARGVEHAVQRDGQLDDAEVRPEVPPVRATLATRKRRISAASSAISRGSSRRRSAGPRRRRNKVTAPVYGRRLGGPGGRDAGVDGALGWIMQANGRGRPGREPRAARTARGSARRVWRSTARRRPRRAPAAACRCGPGRRRHRPRWTPRRS